MAKYARSNELFINPYNFVPVDFKRTPRGKIEKSQENLLTGYLECMIKCRTPLAIPDVARKEPTDIKGHFKYPFFTIDGTNPIIPGSAIRGVIRNVYETLTNSCFGTMKKDSKITARSGQAFRPGLLIREENGNWELYDAKRYLLVTDKGFFDHKNLKDKGVKWGNIQKLSNRTGDKVKFEIVYNNGEEEQYIKDLHNGRTFVIGTYVNITEKSEVSGYLCIGEHAPKRHFQSIFKKCQKIDYSVTEEDFARLETVLAVYRNENINIQYKDKIHRGYAEYEYAKKNGAVPVYYQINKGENILYLTFAALGRKAFINTLDNCAEEKAHQKCNSRNNLCHACALFGTADSEKVGSKVRFTDAECVNYGQEKLLRNITFEELGSPRMSYLPFYLREKRKGDTKGYQEGYDSPLMEIRGRKFYWHHMPDIEKNVSRNERNGTFDVLKQGTKFKFRIYFDRITGNELKWLSSAVHLNENDLEGRFCHKIGHGKPLGYGSVKIFIEGCKVREYCRNINTDTAKWSEKPREIPCDPTCFLCGKDTYDSLRKISDFDVFNNKAVNIQYPEVLLDQQYENVRDKLNDNVLASHHWFSENYKLGRKKDNPVSVLPEISENKLELSKCIASEIYPNKDYKSYKAQVLSNKRNQQNSQFWECDIKILDTDEFNGKRSIATERNSKTRPVGTEISVTFYKEKKGFYIFNIK